MHTNNPMYFVDDGRYPSLAEEISTVAEALTGAPVHAKETVLKILERWFLRICTQIPPIKRNTSKTP